MGRDGERAVPRCPRPARLTWSGGGSSAQPGSRRALRPQRGFEPAHGRAWAARHVHVQPPLLLAQAPAGASKRCPFPATPPLLNLHPFSLSSVVGGKDARQRSGGGWLPDKSRGNTSHGLFFCHTSVTELA